MIENLELKSSVGALLYSPALNNKTADSVIKGKFPTPYSLALCLEDTVADDSVELAEQQVKETIRKIAEAEGNFFLPKIFIRIRDKNQMLRLFEELGSNMSIITGFIFPKYSPTNAAGYNETIETINKKSQKPIYMMPILESRDIADYTTRRNTLLNIKTMLEFVKPYVLNIRVGGNDFSNVFAVRRHYDETIYDILPIAQIFCDILTLFSADYVVSGPVWEYFSSDNEEWKNGLKAECKRDRLNGFIGKTVIHPKQIEVVNRSLMVSNKDYQDAKEILDWDKDGLQVGKSFAGERMNEVKTHVNWAYKTMVLAQTYGVI